MGFELGGIERCARNVTTVRRGKLRYRTQPNGLRLSCACGRHRQDRGLPLGLPTGAAPAAGSFKRRLTAAISAEHCQG
jgi:hypothetical protein